MSNHAAGRRCSASVRLGFSGPMPFFESTYYYHRLLAESLPEKLQDSLPTVEELENELGSTAQE